MKIKITTTSYKKVEKITEVNIPDKQMYLWHNGIRRAYSVKPVWTTWNEEHNNKPEEIYQLEIVTVDPIFNKLESAHFGINILPEILKNEENPYYRVIDNILNYPDENIRTKEQFEQDLNSVWEEILKQI